jgi:uncharacterized membrane protein YhaH (DUF805 family)
MFQNPFSFKGRIRRTEYGFSIIIYFVIAVIINVIGAKGEGAGLIFIAYIPLLWFLWAQGAKRCHDRDNNGWFQIIPFYIFWMLFADSVKRINKYGANPKGIENIKQTTNEQKIQNKIPIIKKVDMNPSEYKEKDNKGTTTIYFEVERPLYGGGLCSDPQCSCSEVPIQRGSGYIYISKDVVNFRKDCIKWKDALSKIQSLKLNGTFIVPNGLLFPYLICEQAAKLRNINLEVASADAKHWWDTGLIPLRVTPFSNGNGLIENIGNIEQSANDQKEQSIAFDQNNSEEVLLKNQLEQLLRDNLISELITVVKNLPDSMHVKAIAWVGNIESKFAVEMLSILMFSSNSSIHKLASNTLWKLLLTKAEPNHSALIKSIIRGSLDDKMYSALVVLIRSLMSIELKRELKVGEMENARNMIDEHMR